MVRFGSGRTGGEEAVPWAISTFGGVLLGAWVLETAYFSGLRADVLLSWGMLVGTAMALPFVAVLLYGGAWLADSDVDEARYRRVGLWCLGGAATFLALNLAGVAAWPPDRLWLTVGWLRNTIGMGAAIGLVIGITEARAVESALRAERSRMRAEHLESRREWLDYLNGLLRHEVLNNAQVIGGYASVLLRDHDLDAEVADRLEAIRRQSDDMTRITEDVRLLIEATRGQDRLRPIDLVDVLAGEVADVEETYEGVEVRADLPESVHVLADEMVRRVFSNLLANAVEHNDGEGARIDVAVEADPETVTVTVTDDGPGVPPSIHDSLFERSRRRAGDHGLGLHLVEQLVRRYDGDVELVETGPEGSTFAVTLHRAEFDEAGPERPSPVEVDADGRLTRGLEARPVRADGRAEPDG